MMPGQVSDCWGFKRPILAVVPATLPMSYAPKPFFFFFFLSFFFIFFFFFLLFLFFLFFLFHNSTHLSNLRPKFCLQLIISKWNQMIGHNELRLKLDKCNDIRGSWSCLSQVNPNRNRRRWWNISSLPVRCTAPKKRIPSISFCQLI